MAESIPVIDVTEKNFNCIFPAIRKAISEAIFIAIDCELSGLGNRSKLNCAQVDERYKNISEIAQDYSIVSLGLSCFTCQSLSSVQFEKVEGQKQALKTQNYVVQTFNILTLCSNPYIVESASMKFLASHGFDFNKQYTQGLPYIKASKEVKTKTTSSPMLKDVFGAILKHEKPLVLHNGLVDLVFLYDSFYTQLPHSSSIFAADLKEMFPNGIFDTKYITEFHKSFPATFLEYIFKKLQLENEQRKEGGDWSVRLKFPPYPASVLGLNWHPYNQIHLQNPYENEPNLPDLCDSYKFHGWCSKGNSCPSSHDINRIVHELSGKHQKRRRTPGAVNVSVAQQLQLLKKQKLARESSDNENENPNEDKKFRVRNRKRKKTSDGSSNLNLEENSADWSLKEENGCDSSPNDSLSFSPDVSIGGNRGRTLCSGHRAGFDAFMTGYIFSCVLSAESNIFADELVNKSSDGRNVLGNMNSLVEKSYCNRIYLIGKEFPFLVNKSAYATQSKNHKDLLNAIKGL